MDQKNQINFSELRSTLREIIILFDLNGKVIDANRAFYLVTGYDDRDVIMQNDLLPGIAFKEGLEPRETELYRKNRTCLPVSGTYIRRQDHCLLFVADDLTEVRRLKSVMTDAEAGQYQALAYKDELLSNVTHELRTPLNGVVGIANLLLESDLDAEQREDVELILHSCRTMNGMIGDLLDFSKIEAGKMHLDNQPFLFREVLNTTLAADYAMINRKGLKLYVAVDDRIPDRLSGDSMRLMQILNNLISNAVKFTSRGHIAIEVNMSKEGPDFVELFFAVIDTGIGIRKEDMGKLFRSFSQVDGSITRRYGGTGLGLAISKRLCEMMGGTIQAESEPEKGSTFSFSVVLRKGVPALDGGQRGAGYLKSVAFPEGRFLFEGNGRYEGAADDDPGTSDKPDNLGAEIRDTCEKLIICIELDNWQRAEEFSDHLKILIEDSELKREVFRLQMDVRREDHDASTKRYDELKDRLFAYADSL